MPHFEGAARGGMYTIDLEYKKSEDIKEKDILGSTANKKRCSRVKNIVSTASDSFAGSTINGKYGYGVPTDPNNDYDPTTKEQDNSGSSDNGSSSGGDS